MLKNFGWKLNRLRTMDVEEVGYRIRQSLQNHAEALGWGWARPPSIIREAGGAPWATPLPRAFDAMPYRHAADRILTGKFDIFALRDLDLGFPPQWNRDPKTGTLAPLVHGKRLNYRDERLVGDIKYLWEPSRHLQVVTLAQAYHLTGERRYADGVCTLLTSWFDQCPYPLGAHWVSSLELAIRLVNWAVTWHLLGGDASPLFAGSAGAPFKARWRQSVYQHCHFIAGYFSRHSSANNHLFGELLGLYVAALTWPCWPESKRWLAQARAELEVEAQKQNHPDGVNCEQATYYHHEVADMMLMVWLVGQANGTPPPSAFVGMLERMLTFIASLMDTAGRVPMIGDADDALLVAWNQGADWDPYRSLLATGAVLFNRPDFKRKAGGFDDKSRWLLGDAAAAVFADLPSTAPAAPKRDFPDGGYFVLGDAFDTPGEVRVVADAAPLGYLSIAAHGHADALAFTLTVGGTPILVDPGTYAYHTQKKWRDYFRGTSAHNTVRVDGLDQSESGGNFMWLRKARTQCEQWESTPQHDCLVANHDGYTRLPDPVRHRRKLTFDKPARRLVVEDTLECLSQHQVEFHWHFGETCAVQVDGRCVDVSAGPVRVAISMTGSDAPAELARGQEDPPLGWISWQMDSKVPAPTLVWRETITGTVRRTTVFEIVAP